MKESYFSGLAFSLTLGILGYFKYLNFFMENFELAFTSLGFAINTKSLNIILPVGISFYTFQALGYIIDVYKHRLDPEKDLITFAAFICFFPKLLAGPIESATNLLPQFLTKRHFEYTQAAAGLKQILWGCFQESSHSQQLCKVRKFYLQ